MNTLFWLLVAHALCDYPLQGDFLARAKNHRAQIPGVPWQQALVAHALIHAAAVYLLTGRPWLAFAELLAHTAIDYAKSDVGATVDARLAADPALPPAARAYGGSLLYHIDQALHVACKLLWWVLL